MKFIVIPVPTLLIPLLAAEPSSFVRYRGAVRAGDHAAAKAILREAATVAASHSSSH